MDEGEDGSDVDDAQTPVYDGGGQGYPVVGGADMGVGMDVDGGDEAVEDDGAVEFGGEEDEAAVADDSTLRPFAADSPYEESVHALHNTQLLPGFLRPRNTTPRLRTATRTAEFDRRRPLPRQRIVVRTQYSLRRDCSGSAATTRTVTSAPASMCEEAPDRAPVRWRFLGVSALPPPPRGRRSLPGADDDGDRTFLLSGPVGEAIADAGVADLVPNATIPPPPPPTLLGAAAALRAIEAPPIQKEDPPPDVDKFVPRPPPAPTIYTHHLHPGKYGRAVLNNPVTRPMARVVAFAPSKPHTLPPVAAAVLAAREARKADLEHGHPALPPSISESLTAADDDAESEHSSEQRSGRSATEPEPLSVAPADPSTQSLAVADILSSPRGAAAARERIAKLLGPKPAPPPWWQRQEHGGHSPPRQSGRNSPHTRAARIAARSSGVRGRQTVCAKQAVTTAVLVVICNATIRQAKAVERIASRPQVRFRFPAQRSMRLGVGSSLDRTESVRLQGREEVAKQKSGESKLQVTRLPEVNDDDPLNRHMCELFEDLQDTWRSLAKDPSATLRDLDRGEVLLSLKKDYLKRHPLPRARMADSLPQELQHCATTITGTDGVQHIVTVQNKGGAAGGHSVPHPPHKQQRRRRDRRRGGDMAARGRPYSPMWWLPKKRWAPKPVERRRPGDNEVTLKQLLAEHSLTSREVRRIPSLTDADGTPLAVNVLGGLVPLTDTETERIEELLDAQKKAVAYLHIQGKA
eukprot:TRINITY_DN20662_c0_g1_i1.p1 TRINITY_DN20662_c0_g1~~TRINITY_DN20662_c0_g1_i1.p1  ORF type:complete len:767 (+),score=198.42 TRINITY_DN20662_c0_g1_i1:56-2302(+)